MNDANGRQRREGNPGSNMDDRLYASLVASDILVAKALRITEVPQIALAETRLRQLYEKSWRFHSVRALKAANAALSGTSPEITQAQLRAALKAVDREMAKWASDVLPKARDAVKTVYTLARAAGAKKATGESKASLSYTPRDTRAVVKKADVKASAIMSFDLADEAAIAAMQDHQTFWIGRHYKENVSETIGEVSGEVMLETGGSRSVAGAKLSEEIESKLGAITIPGGYSGTATAYFEGLAANAVTTARVAGQLRSFELAEMPRYVIVNPRDERTCPTCGHMDGKEFSIEQGRSTMDASLAAETPEEVKEAHPWIGTKGMLEISPEPGYSTAADSASLADAGFNLPPFHFRCRCTVDIA